MEVVILEHSTKNRVTQKLKENKDACNEIKTCK